MRSPDPGRGRRATPVFRVRVGGFDGPFDLLLDLIGRHELDVTELALSIVTDEFLAHLEHLGDDADLDQTSGFLVVGATLLDAKIAGLLPAGEVVDAEAVAMLEARDLLFARLLQYRAFKEATAWFADALAVEGARHAHRGAMREQQLPRPRRPSCRSTSPRFAMLAAFALRPATRADGRARPPPRLRGRAPRAGRGGREPAPPRRGPVVPRPHRPRGRAPGRRSRGSSPCWSCTGSARSRSSSSTPSVRSWCAGPRKTGTTRCSRDSEADS